MTRFTKEQKLTQLATGVDKRAMNLAASWYVAMPSKNLGQKPKAIELFGQSLVAWRDERGYPVIMERYCSHLGASLAIGEVVNSCIQCPFHHWRYDSSGQCVFIPDVDNLPKLAHQATYVTIEKYDYIWVWYGSQTPLFPLVEFSAIPAQKQNYMHLRFACDIQTTVQQVVENAFDYYHIITLHKEKASAPVRVTLLDDLHSSPQSNLSVQKEAWLGVLDEFLVSRPLGLNAQSMTVRVDAWPSGSFATVLIDGKERLNVMLCTTPVGINQTTSHLWFMVKKTGNFFFDVLYYLLFARRSKINGEQDIVVWNTMKPDAGKIYVKHDWLLIKFREFYQRWVNRVE